MATNKTTQNITEKIKSFEDAKKATNRPGVPDFSNVPEDLREYFEAHYKMIVIGEALNEGVKMDWLDSNQKKWFPWLYNAPASSGFVFDGTYCCYSDAGIASRLCFKSEELARYAGKQFLDIQNAILIR